MEQELVPYQPGIEVLYGGANTIPTWCYSAALHCKVELVPYQPGIEVLYGGANTVPTWCYSAAL